MKKYLIIGGSECGRDKLILTTGTTPDKHHITGIELVGINTLQSREAAIKLKNISVY